MFYKYIAYYIVLVLYTRQLSSNILPETLKTIKFRSNLLVFLGVVEVAIYGIYWGVSPKYRSVMKGSITTHLYVCVCVCVCVSVKSEFDICTDRFLVLLVHQDSFF